MNYSENDSEFSTRFEFFPGLTDEVIEPNASRGERSRRNLELDGSCRWPQIVGVSPEVGFDFERSRYDNRGEWNRSNDGAGIHRYQDRGQNSTRSVYAKVVRTMGPSMTVNAGLRKTWYQCEGTQSRTRRGGGL